MRRLTTARLAAAAVLCAALLSSCTSSGGTARSTSAAASAPASSSAQSSPPPVSSSATPTPTPKPTPTPLSAFEKDPGVQAYRAWAAEAGRTVNTGHTDSPALQRLMSAAFAKEMSYVLGPDIGTHYPGPLPFQPLGVKATSTRRDIRGCLETNGWTQNPKTHKPARARQVQAANVVSVVQGGRWILDYFDAAHGFSCAHVTVRTQRW